MGIAIPEFIIASKNNIWVLGLYGLIFGLGLPALVVSAPWAIHSRIYVTITKGRWWFGSRNYTKDGVQARTAEFFFKAIKEEMPEKDIMQSLGSAFPWERPIKPKTTSERAADEIRRQIDTRIGREWIEKAEVSA